jgi:hypothetical protein
MSAFPLAVMCHRLLETVGYEDTYRVMRQHGLGAMLAPHSH